MAVGVPCIRKCGNNTDHKSGVCKDCRAVKCTKCQKPFVPFSVKTKAYCKDCEPYKSTTRYLVTL